MVSTAQISNIQHILVDAFSKFESVEGVSLSGDEQQFYARVVTNDPTFDRAGMDVLLKAEYDLLNCHPDLRLFIDYFPLAGRNLEDVIPVDAILLYRR